MEEGYLSEFDCLGLKWLGACSYDPANPLNIYFDIGSAIAALGFLLAIQQLLKPIYQFRLSCLGIRFRHLSLAVVLGFLMALFAALAPNLPVPRGEFWAYPIFWEICGGAIIATTYGVAGFVMLTPARLMEINYQVFIRAAANLLSEARDEDRVAFARDIERNISKVFEFAHAWDIAERHASNRAYPVNADTHFM